VPERIVFHDAAVLAKTALWMEILGAFLAGTPVE